jgi:hypothetical protein
MTVDDVAGQQESIDDSAGQLTAGVQGDDPPSGADDSERPAATDPDDDQDTTTSRTPRTTASLKSTGVGDATGKPPTDAGHKPPRLSATRCVPSSTRYTGRWWVRSPKLMDCPRSGYWSTQATNCHRSSPKTARWTPPKSLRRPKRRCSGSMPEDSRSESATGCPQCARRQRWAVRRAQ